MKIHLIEVNDSPFLGQVIYKNINSIARFLICLYYCKQTEGEGGTTQRQDLEEILELAGIINWETDQNDKLTEDDLLLNRFSLINLII